MAGIAALGAVLESLERSEDFRSLGELAGFRERLADSLRAAIPSIVFNNPFDQALPTTLNFSVPGFSSRTLLDLFDAAGIRVSSGSACSAVKAEPSFVLQAMGLPDWQAASAIRMSFGPADDSAFIDRACRRIVECGAALRAKHPSDLSPPTGERPGVMQFTADGLSSWLLLDTVNGSCVWIDAWPETAADMERTVARLGYRQVATLHTAQAAHRDWVADTRVTLADGSVADAMRFGPQVLARIRGPEGFCFLLGRAVDGTLDAASVRFAFCASLAPTAPMRASANGQSDPVDPRAFPAQLQAVICPRTLACAARDGNGFFITTWPPSHAPDQVAIDDKTLPPYMLESFLTQHEDAILVDLRESFELLVEPSPTWCGRVPLHVPASQLADQFGRWLHEDPRPLVFLCRSGKRSSRAALHLRTLGHPAVWHMAGGMALASATAQGR